MAIEEVNQELWALAEENVTKQQEEAFDALFDEAVEEHLKGECAFCKEELCSNCEARITNRIEERQESQFDERAEAEYDRLVEQQQKQEEEYGEGLDNGIMLTPSIEIRWNKSRTELSINHKPSRTCIMDFEVHDGKLESVYYDSDPSFWQQ